MFSSFSTFVSSVSFKSAADIAVIENTNMSNMNEPKISLLNFILNLTIIYDVIYFGNYLRLFENC